MKQLGVSVYPGAGNLAKDKEYISKAAQYGFRRVFTCLISAAGDKSTLIKDFSELAGHAKALDMEIVADVSPSVFNSLGAGFSELKLFHELGLSGIRLDMGFSGLEESIMTFNPYNLKIELNMSLGSKCLENILSYSPKADNLIGCHNFYPHRYTGLSRKHFTACSRIFKENGIRTAAFISSKKAELGPWPVKEGLCTLEEHRSLPIEVQAKDLFNTGMIDEVIIANAYASEEELGLLGSMDRNLLVLNVELIDNIPDTEKKIVLEELHFNRGDISEYMIRSTQSREKYKGYDFKLLNPKGIKRGDVLIDSSLYGRYAGELQIALKDMENSRRTSVLGRVNEAELYLLDHIEPWQKFRLKLIRP